MAEERDGIWIIDSNAQTTYANNRMAEILGTTAAEMTGQPSFEFVFPEDIHSAQMLFETKRSGSLRPFAFTLRRKNGSPVRVTVQGTPLINAAGDFKGIVGTFTQIS